MCVCAFVCETALQLPTCVNLQLVSSGSWLPAGSHCSILECTAQGQAQGQVYAQVQGRVSHCSILECTAQGQARGQVYAQVQGWVIHGTSIFNHGKVGLKYGYGKPQMGKKGLKYVKKCVKV